MLQGLAGISTETMFSGPPVPDLLELRLEELKATGVPYGKKQLAEQLGVKPYQLDILARNYGMGPFWKGAKGNQHGCFINFPYIGKFNQKKVFINAKGRLEHQLGYDKEVIP